MVILSMQEIGIFGFTWTWMSILAALVLVILGSFILYKSIKYRAPELLLILVLLCIASPLVFIFGQTPIGSYTQYKVYLNDETQIKEILAKYRIINQEGLILTLIEK